MIKNQQDFIDTSFEQMKKLNGDTTETAMEGWRAGYMFAQKFVKECIETEFADDCIDRLQEFSDVELSEFDH